ncbi:threonine-phosphate decarboxylase CobD [Marinobacterium lutimaris]|uniref:threonine-phosphate decarboxylase n=1 Tax=Marinobacterium lutimaris TaxID=568106 RepID=A0A1H6D9X8_9GAMM|nr:threonine-phosphate decarboxylase CobD [Marinobacterium lutimaris]SEG82069.1 L-threonine O-3-phosphate decarboxylase [Marinobacterium lutimaris]
MDNPDFSAQALRQAQVQMPEHGGRLRRAVAEYGIPLERWVDLSTGINPCGWTIPLIDNQTFMRLPENDDELEAAAAEYYGSSDLVPVAGSQEAIRELPRIRQQLFGESRVGVIAPGYEEHRYHWQLNGHQVERLAAEQIETELHRFDCLVLINPCNPSAVRFDQATLARWHQQLAARGGWLVIDEAFLDTEPQQSMIQPQMPSGLIVLRSLGKFFGLAGLRVGFLFADAEIRQMLSRAIGHWSIATPSRWLATRALWDTSWQQEARTWLESSRQRLVRLLEEALEDLPGSLQGRGLASTGLFVTVQIDDAAELAHRLAQQGILVRYFEPYSSLRFGLPGNEHEWRHLARSLTEATAAESQIQV